jgi:hypothetical protein
MAVPKPRDAVTPGGAVHGLDVWSPVGMLSGPVFRVVDDHLIVATSAPSLEAGVALARTSASWSTPDWVGAARPPDEIAVVQLNELAGVLLAGPSRLSSQDGWSGPLAAFLANSGEGRLSVYYEADGFRIKGELDIVGDE